MWRSVFLHEFPNADVHSLQALPGQLSFGPTPLHVESGGVTLSSGRGLRYAFRDTVRQVIGVSCRIKLRSPFQPISQTTPLLRMDNAFQVSVQPIFTGASVALQLGETRHDLAVIPLPYQRFIDLRIDWHTSGQVFLRVDGHLVGYHNALSPGAHLSVANLTLGFPDPDTARNQRHDVGRLFIRTLSRADSMAALVRELPAIEAPEDAALERCRWLLMVNLLDRLDRIRAFMTQVNATLSHPWPEPGNPSEGPFAPEAMVAHDLAIQTVVDLKKILRSGDFTSAETFLSHFSEFVEILYRARPTEFQQLAVDLEPDPELPSECREALDRVLAQPRSDLAPLLALLNEAGSRITQIAQEGQGHGPKHPS